MRSQVNSFCKCKKSSNLLRCIQLCRLSWSRVLVSIYTGTETRQGASPPVWPKPTVSSQTIVARRKSKSCKIHGLTNLGAIIFLSKIVSTTFSKTYWLRVDFVVINRNFSYQNRTLSHAFYSFLKLLSLTNHIRYWIGAFLLLKFKVYRPLGRFQDI